MTMKMKALQILNQGIKSGTNMTREDAKQLLPIITAFAEGKKIELRCVDGQWREQVDIGFTGLAEEYRIAPEVGSAEWANSLPDGTQIRRVGGWSDKTKFVLRRGDYWETNLGKPWVSKNTLESFTNSRWELYTPPARRIRAWTLETVPNGISRIRDIGEKQWFTVQSADENGLWVGGPANVRISWIDLSTRYEHSLDHGKTCRPCGVEEEA